MVQVVLDRKFVMAVSGLIEDGESCQTDSASGKAGTTSALGNWYIRFWYASY